ncbi:MAG: hypothetical protein PUB63_03230 [Clostridia bacterium]|nr:hypothetical protein [Clostridia bacterium]
MIHTDQVIRMEEMMKMPRKICLFILLLCCLTGCRGEEIDTGAISEYYAGLECLTVEAAITANSGVQVTYEILFTRTAEGDRVEILAPESLAGIRARILPDKAEIEYDGMAVETLLPGISGYVPADVVTGAAADLAGGVPESFGYDQLDGARTLLLTYVEDVGDVTARKMLWLDPGSYSLLRGEFYLGEQMIMELRVKSFLA